MSVTIADIADHLDISVSTVSKALNDYDDVSPATRERVLEAAHSLGYHPSATARNLRRRRTQKLGFLFLLDYPVTTISEYLAELMTGAAIAAEQEDYHLVLYTTSANQLDRLAQICRAREVDGLLLLGAERMEQKLSLLENESIPFVVVGRRVNRPNVSYVAPDNLDGALVATRHLIALGHRHIGCMARPEFHETNQDRLAGYRQALEEAGLPFDKQLVAETSTRDDSSGRRALDSLLQRDPAPTAVLAFNDYRAVETLHAAKERNLRVPEDIAIVGFDGIHASLITTPPLTTVKQPLQEIGTQSVELLLARIRDGERSPIRRVLPVELIVRQSTAGA